MKEADARCAADAIDQVAARLAALVLARTPEELMWSATLPESTDGSHPAAARIDILAEAVRMTELRQRMLRSAYARVLATACFVQSVDRQ